MSNERNVEAVGCDASIMKNVWEIRERDYEQKMNQEEDRKSKSALTSINKEWSMRLAARQGNYKRPERKPRTVENQEDNDVWKTKKAEAPPPLPRGVPGSGPRGTPGSGPRGTPGSGSLSRPAVQSRGPSTTQKEKKMLDKSLMRLQLLMFINQGQPSGMVWGKSWKYNKALPAPAEADEARSDWGQCWMFATQQPFTEAGQPWKNGPNMMDPKNLLFWERLETRMVESEELDLSLPEDEWHASWKRSDKTNKDKSADGENFSKYGRFSELEHTQQHNEELCSSEWSESWMSTKPGEEQDDFTASEDGPMQQDNNKDMSSMSEDWKLSNHHGRNNVNTTQIKKSLSSEWVNSWRAAMMVFNNHMNSDASMNQGEMGTCAGNGQHRESHIYKVSLSSQEKKHRNLYSQLLDEFEALSEWTKSWEVTKNNSKPCEEIEKVLKLSQDAVSQVQKIESKAKEEHHSTSNDVDPRYEQLRHSVMYHPKREFTQSQVLRMKHLGNALPAPEWKDSWRTVKHRRRMERRRYRPEPASPFRVPEKGGDRKPAAAEWKDSWKHSCQPLHQEPEQWEQGWTTMPQVRVDRAREQNHFAPVELPKNGPTTEHSWEQSWRFMRHQRQSGQGRVRPQTSQGRPSVPSHQRRCGSDWQDAWMVSETQYRHDRPSLIQWRDAWQWSIFHTEGWIDEMPRENRLSERMEIEPQRGWMSSQRAQAKMSRSFEEKMFKERYPEKQWNASWKAGPLLSYTTSGSSGTTGNNKSSTVQQQHATTNGHGSKWGRSFRIANPMPQLEQPWVQSSPNTSQYTVMLIRGMTTPNKTNPKFSNSPVTFNQWGTSHRFLQGASTQTKDKTQVKPSVDPMVIVTKHINSRMNLHSKLEKPKQADKTWVGCHLLGKTQPKPKRGATPVKTSNMGGEDDKFYAEWAESWKFLVKAGAMKKQMISLRSWTESWKFLVPLYPPTNGTKTK
ncbi:uncharacterized protein LOC117831361 [Notolabrus celidotus]|uniref:uncharacterized protein LOC117831361 n=1 Tax=Notolabrus celidotus TaxID=1203425 RepID=UPI001490555B|nr:uncharacterized protein LOC117831361 [Notolabrus celidotus]